VQDPLFWCVAHFDQLADYPVVSPEKARAFFAVQILTFYGVFEPGLCFGGFAFSLEHWNLYDASPAWRALTTGTTEEKMAKMRDPELRGAVIRETEEADRRLGPRLSQPRRGPRYPVWDLQ